MNLAQQIGLTAEEAGAIGGIAADLMAAEDYEGARVVLEGLTVLNPDDAATWAALGIVHHSSGDLANAEVSYRECLRREPGQPTALAYLGELLLGRGEPEGRRLLQTAIADVAFARTETGQRVSRLLK